MVINDPVGDMLTRIRNAQKAGHPSVVVPASRMKESIAKILQDEGFIIDYAKVPDSRQGALSLSLKYVRPGQPLIQGLRRASRPGLRDYKRSTAMPKIHNGLGVAIVTTNKGIMTDREARKQNVGGEVLCYVW